MHITYLLSQKVFVVLRRLILRRLHGPLVHPVDAFLAIWAVASGGLSDRGFKVGRCSDADHGSAEARHEGGGEEAGEEKWAM